MKKVSLVTTVPNTCWMNLSSSVSPALVLLVLLNITCGHISNNDIVQDPGKWPLDNLEYQFLSLTHTSTDYHINHSSQHSEARTPTALKPWPSNPKRTLAWRRELCHILDCHNPVRLRRLDHRNFQPFRIKKIVLKKKKRNAQKDRSTKMYWVHLVYLPIKFCHISLQFFKKIWFYSYQAQMRPQNPQDSDLIFQTKYWYCDRLP